MRIRWLVCLWLLVSAVGAQAQGRQIPLAEFFRKSEFRNVSISPDGGTLGAISPGNGRYNLVVMDLATRKVSQLTTFEAYDVIAFRWVNASRILFTLGNTDDRSGYPRRFGLYGINKDGSDSRTYASDKATRYIQLLGGIRDNPGEVLVLNNDRAAEFSDVYRMNLATGRREILTFDSPGRVLRWIVDRNGVPRAAVSKPEGSTRAEIHYRDSAGAPWIRINEYALGGEGIEPLAFDEDNRTLIVASNIGRDKRALYRYDPATRSLKDLLVESDEFDVGAPAYVYGLNDDAVVREAETGKVLGISYAGYRPGTFWIDPESRTIQQMVDRALPDTVNTVRRIGRTSKALVLAASDRQPGIYMLLDLEKKTLAELVRSRPWVKPEEMAAMRVVEIKTRDGLLMPAYLSVPAGSDGRNLPLVLNPHGGPWARDHWGYDPEVQFLANRGYAVLQPQFRISTGFGRRLFVAGFREWGGRMQDDLTDAVRWAIDQGIADPRRICIYGASYGGYAALMGVVKTPELFRCGVNYVGVSDLELFFSRSFFGNDFLDNEQRQMVGDPSADREMLRAASPVNRVADIRVPLFMAYGGDDLNVPIEHGLGMKRALERAGKSFEWIVKETEAHGFAKAENRDEFYRTLEAFLRQHLK